MKLRALQALSRIRAVFQRRSDVAVPVPDLEPLEPVPSTEPVSANLAAEFLIWLCTSLDNGDMAYNRSGSKVHFVKEGMLLASPAIFQRYEQAHEGTDWRRVQRAFSKSPWCLQDQGRTVFSYQVRHWIAGKPPRTLHCVIVPKPGALLNHVPRRNPRLVRDTRARPASQSNTGARARTTVRTVSGDIVTVQNNRDRALHQENQPAAPALPMQMPVLLPIPEHPLAPLATPFLTWVLASLQRGTLPYNQPGALVHFVAEGMLLASPNIFKRYTLAMAATGSPVSSGFWLAVQKDFVKSPFALRENDKNVFQYIIRRDSELQGNNVLHGVIASNPHTLVMPVPELNARLQRLHSIEQREAS